uniref:Uncharacterized protein n=1 Tax=Pristionchus pacificus TaxID=54126 RepID=A0A2A6C596_PRIPA|eukprot:PDM73191.1 hypothetical protein PRIPAC_43287 [Pristionchus pacificus]
MNSRVCGNRKRLEEKMNWDENYDRGRGRGGRGEVDDPWEENMDRDHPYSRVQSRDDDEGLRRSLRKKEPNYSLLLRRKKMIVSFAVPCP